MSTNSRLVNRLCVELVDFGVTLDSDVSDVYMIPEELRTIPVHAILCRLVDVESLPLHALLTVLRVYHASNVRLAAKVVSWGEGQEPVTVELVYTGVTARIDVVLSQLVRSYAGCPLIVPTPADVMEDRTEEVVCCYLYQV